MQEKLSRRERQIMDLIYQKGKATAIEVREGIAEPPSYSAIRTHLRILEEKRVLKHEKAGAQYVYFPQVSPEKAKKSALKHLLNTFFEGSAENAFASLLEVSKNKLKEEEYLRMRKMIDQAKKKEDDV